MAAKEARGLHKGIFALLGAYLWRQRKVLLLFAAFTGVCVLVLFMYQQELEAVFYAFLLCAALGAVVFAARFWRYVRRHRQMEVLRENIALSLDGLPAPEDLLERDYQALLTELFAEKQAIASGAAAARQDMLEYYTLWVHQVKTPIAAMRLLLREDDEQDGALLVELMRIEQYVDMVLQYLRMQGDTTDFVLRRCSLDSILRAAVKKYALLFIRKGLRVQFTPTETEVLTDEKWLSFVIEQVLSNALKYTQTGEIRLYLQPGKEKTLVIEDTGIGIAAQDLPRVFDRGFTGENGRTGRASTGIGLYLCRRIMRKLSHGISIESEQGKGTRVLLDLAMLDVRPE